MNHLRRNSRFIFLQLVLVLGYCFWLRLPAWLGQELVLKVAKPGRKDQSIGNMLHLRPSLTRIHQRAGEPTQPRPQPGDTVFLSLISNNPEGAESAQLSHFSLERPEKGVFLRGTVQAIEKDWLRLRFGFETWEFFESLEPESKTALNEGRLLMRIAVDGDGDASILGLEIQKDPPAGPPEFSHSSKKEPASRKVD